MRRNIDMIIGRLRIALILQENHDYKTFYAVIYFFPFETWYSYPSLIFVPGNTNWGEG